MYLARTPELLAVAFPDLLWHMDRKDPLLYLTFDDGPDPEVTPWVLDQLHEHSAKATFFCVGKNIEAHPAIFQRILDEGHAVGNHTWDHRNGWRTSNSQYMRSVLRCQERTRSDLFRPPYGRITPTQVRALKKRYRIVMWDVLSGDFDRSKDARFCINAVCSNTRNGSIIVFHDSQRAFSRLKGSLPHVLKNAIATGHRFSSLPTTGLPDACQA